MGYEINVSKDGRHYFATAERSIGNDKKRRNEIYFKLKEFFPKSEGYRITVNMLSHTSESVAMVHERMTFGEEPVGEEYFDDELDPAGGYGLSSHI